MDATALKQILGEQIHRLHGGKGDPKIANSIANTAGKLLSTVRLELDYSKRLGLTPPTGFTRLGSPAAKPAPKRLKK